jgi:phage shock protein PspC (stress-responsive transcriptional regulator)
MNPDAPKKTALLLVELGQPKEPTPWERLLLAWHGPPPQVKLETFELHPDRAIAASAVYEALAAAVRRLEVPGVKLTTRPLPEAGPLGADRLYLSVRREFSEFLVCVAPVGVSTFVSVRSLDRFPHVRWLHYLVAFGVFAGLAGALLVALTLLQTLVVLALAVTFLWSVARYAKTSEGGWAERLPELPVLGPLYLRWFRPDTFYRQDVHQAFTGLVRRAVQGVLAGLDDTQPLRPVGGQPTVP